MFNFTYYSNFIKSLFKSERTSLLPRSFYISDHILERENKYLFGKLWIFAGLKNEIPDDGCWMIKKIGFKEVIIINDKDQYYAHENVCPHRNKRLKVQDYGRGPLVCGYHAWSFKPNGDLNKIPNFERSYLLTENQMKKACLTSYKVQLLGNFIFINLSENPIPINEQFDTTILKSLKLLSQRLHKSYAKLKETRKFNWKLNFENLRDAMHPEVVHATTLANHVDFSEQYVQQKPLTESLRKIELSECSYFSKDGEPKEGQKGHLDDLIKPSFGRGYYNWVLFPNFHMASPDGGRTYYIEVHNPSSPDQTDILHYTISNKPNNPDDIFLKEVLEHRLQGTRPVMEEDYAACEEVQYTLKNTDREQIIGAYEHYNANISDAYRRIIRY